MTNALITGISGFIGQYLQTHLASKNISVFGFDAHGLEQKNIFKGNIADRKSVTRALEISKPDIIFHLAGILKSAEMDKFYEVHAVGTAVLLDAVLEIGLSPHVVIASSSAVYGGGVGKKPITELFKPRPATHYAASKLAQEIVAMRYYVSSGLRVTCVRTFNLLGPGLSSNMAPSAFAKQIAQAEMKHKPKKIFTGDLSARRDYLDVRDAVRAYYLIAKHGVPGQIYNVCSGQAVSVEECLQILMDQTNAKVERVFDPSREQQHDVPVQVGSAQKIQREFGWQAKIPIKRSLLDLLNDWRKKIKQENHK